MKKKWRIKKLIKSHGALDKFAINTENNGTLEEETKGQLIGDSELESNSKVNIDNKYIKWKN